MNPDVPDVSSLQNPQRQLERALIDEFLRRQGYEPAQADLLPEPQRTLLMTQASAYASGKLAEVDARAHLVHELHGDIEAAHKHTPR